MEVAQISERAKCLNEMILNIELVMRTMDLYEPSRPGSLAYTKLEEAVLWLQVMNANVALKPSAQAPVESEVLPPDDAA